MFGLEPQEVELSEIRQYAERIGKTNKYHNIYAAAVKLAEDYEELGLTPVVYQDRLSGGLLVTSEEYINHKFH